MTPSTRRSKFSVIVKGVDLQDCLILSGVVSGEAAAFIIWRPAALLLACALSFGFAFLIQRSKKVKS